ncbi:PP2C family protein-serine/threonine phosphatase [Streptomyces sp. NPDC020681]|uniref:PP2C family protein-serine/threonine phosphatase n=1 Tax=Streptomyces sp. NPDC020681 TaxID=3365083 RepID=UPI0037B9387F
MVLSANEPDGPDAVKSRGRRAGSLSWRVVVFWLVVITAILAVTAIYLGRESRLAPLLVVLPALIAGRGTVRQTEFASVWVTVVIAASLIDTPMETVGATVGVLVFVVVFNSVSVAGAAQRLRREGEIARLRSAAAALQRQILRPFPLLTDELLVHGLYEPVEEDSQVGGDIYEVVDSPFGSRVFIGDVQGKGLPAISAAFAVLTAFREAALAEPTLTAVVDALEVSVLRHNSFAAQAGGRERFVTALVFSIGSGSEAQAINCGHVEPYLLHGEQTRPALRHEPSVPLGLASLTPEPRTVEWFDFPPGSSLLLCTDGVTEARDAAGTFYPLEERVTHWGKISPSEVASTVHRELQQHTGGKQTDDTALLVLRRRSAAGLE